ncbi:Site-specific recombinase XerD [Actinopolymorpha cephalotaxi]|uniref:Site-specific recombinase XerD n=1 Tax=Actinopolymorpha cephalotaxi TaxID=504797 RepID=A0A1I2SJ65_9ACTN|nr:site-specific integrase [Actinopolymorpha cephalotaxi]SFG52523.1 Site-specific recombinase XerD [Actinopolymorpha cephalotaxi]
MARSGRRRQRHRGEIEERPSGNLRVKVYVGTDPLTKRRRYLTESIPAGPRAYEQAEKALTRLQNQVDEQRHPRTSATVNQLIDKWLTDVVDVATSTRTTYEGNIRKHIRPILGPLQVGRVNAEVIDSFYAELRRCRDHCNGRRRTEHRTDRPHECDARCGKHKCRGLAPSSRRQIHWILSGMFTAAMRWRWIAVNPIDQTEAPAQPAPNPTPPSTEEAARLVEEAWNRDPDWGTFVWLAMALGARRGELCALRWSDIDLTNGLVFLQRALTRDLAGELVEKSTKTHQHRRVVLDPETVEVLAEHRTRCQAHAQLVGEPLAGDGYVFSPEPGGCTPPAPASISQRYERMAASLRIRTTLHKLRHYSATELIAAGVDVRTIAGRLGHGGGGATTLRVYAAWVSEADQRAAKSLAGRMPPRPRRRSAMDLDAPAPIPPSA